MQDLQNNNEYTFTWLDFAAIKFEGESRTELHVAGTLTHTVYLASLSGGQPDPLFFTPIPTTLYLYEGCLTSGLVQGNDCLEYWIHPQGQVLDLKDDQVTRVHVPGQRIHLLRTAQERERKQSQDAAGIPVGDFTTPVNQVSTSTAFPLPIEAKFDLRVTPSDHPKTHVCTSTSPKASSQARNTLTAKKTLFVTSRRTPGSLFEAQAKKAREGRLKKAQEDRRLMPNFCLYRVALISFACEIQIDYNMSSFPSIAGP